uniref:D5-like helicase-primase n=1 Tax=Pithovirus LCPAC404 TaxID=2506597 RepID=A0A481ZCX3_9VIRU|nr:MAG: D5-like helicase-primase [Pithovirus LCPAC404]
MSCEDIAKLSRINSLRDYFVTSKKHSHRFAGSKTGLWLPEKNRGKFWYEYLQLNREGYPKPDLRILEFLDNDVSFTTRFTFTFNEVHEDVPYTDEFVSAIVTVHQDIINDKLCFKNQMQREHRYFCCVYEHNTQYIDSDTYTLKLDFYFPYVNVKSRTVTKVLLPELITALKESNVLEHMEANKLDRWDKIIKCDYSTPVPLPGSSGGILTSCFTRVDDNGSSILINQKDIISHIDISNHTDVKNGQVDIATLRTLSHGDENLGVFIMPFVLSSGFTPTGLTIPCEIKAEDDKPVDLDYFPTDIEMASTFLDMLGPDRVSIYAYWVTIGKCLHTIFDGAIRGLTVWKDFTKKYEEVKSEKYDYDCEKKYFQFNQKSLTVKTLAWFAKKDNPTTYKRWEKDWISSGFSRAFTGSQVDVAKVIYRCYWLEYICTSFQKKEWFMFNNHTWIPMDGQVALHLKIRGEFRDRIVDLKDLLIKKIESVQDGQTKDDLENKINTLNTLLDSKHLGSPGWINTLVGEVAIRFYTADVNDYMDENPNLTGMLNGVIETNDTGAFFREGMPEDYISKSTGIRWKDFDKDDSCVEDLQKYMKEVFPDDDLRHYVRKLAASWLTAGNPYKKFIIFTGDTDASKSIFKKVIETAFGLGRYVVNLPISVFTQKRCSGPSPELAQARATKLLITQEPDNDEVFRGGIIKELSGGDSMFTRGLYKDGGSMTATWQVILICNKVPEVFGADKAIHERMSVVPFLSLFKRKERILTSEEKEKHGKNIFDVDPFFDQKIPNLAQAFIWQCVNDYKAFVDEGIESPSIVIKTTRDYWKDSDSYLKFLDEEVDIIPYDPNVKISVAKLFKMYSNWNSEANPSSQRISRSTFEYELKQRNIKIKDRFVIGMKSRNDEADGYYMVPRPK